MFFRSNGNFSISILRYDWGWINERVVPEREESTSKVVMMSKNGVDDMN